MPLGSWGRRQTTSFVRDLTFGVRVLIRAPLATCIMVASTAIGIGVTTAVFTLADVMLFRPLPYPNADRLVVPYQTVIERSRARQDTVNWTFAQFEVLAQTMPVFDDAGFATWVDAMARVIDEDRPVRVEAVTPSIMSTFSLQAQTGRLLSSDDDAPSAASTAGLISDHLWRAAYGASSSIVGSTIDVNGAPVTIVGIMPRGFTGFAIGADVWLPIHMMARIEPSARWTERLANQTGTVIARATPGISVQRTRVYLRAAYPIVNQVATAAFVAQDADRDVGVMTLAQSRQHPLVKPMLELMGVAVAILLVIVCANIASILLARGYSRRSETGIRIAMGASRARVKIAALTESAILGLFALPIGVLLAYLFASAVGDLRPPLPQNWVLLRGTDLLADASLAPNGRVLLFAVLVAAVSTLLFGIAPAVAQSRVDAAKLITAGGDSHATAPVRGRQLLVTTQIALATMLLVGAGLMTKSLRALLATDLGFDPNGVVMLQVSSMDTSSAARVRRADFLAGLTSLPGVQQVSTSGCVQFDLSCLYITGVRATETADPTMRPVDAEVHGVSADYFKVFKIPTVAGRAFIPEDTTVGEVHVVLGLTAARRLYGDPNKAVGKRVAFDDETARPMRVIGVVRDVRFVSVEGEPSPAIYLLAGEDAQAAHLRENIFVRSTLGPSAAIATIRHELKLATMPMSISDARPMSDIVRDATSSTRFVALLLVGFAAAALILAALGVYGVIAYIIAQRAREMSIRLVLGAEMPELARVLVVRGAALVGGGIVIGVALALAASRVISGLLFDVQVFDLPTLLGVAAIVGVVGLFATAVSTWRVGKIDVGLAMRL